MDSNGGMVSSLTSLSLTDPQCNNDSCLAFQAAHNLSQATVSYYYQYEYGHFTVYYFAAVIGVASLIFTYDQWHDRRSPTAHKSISRRPSWRDKLQACRRSVSYRHLQFPYEDVIRPPSVGILASLLLFLLFLTLLAFAVRPYYRGHRGYGSPPLAIRTGLMAAALTPLLVALGGKVNIVTLLTGVGYEKLNVIHRWVGWFCLGISVVHAIPFIVAPLRDGGYEALREQFYEPGAYEYTGTPALGMLFGLVILSLPCIRRHAYELFYYAHFAIAIAYLGLCFWHFDNEGDSWYYLWATVAVWLFSVLGRLFYKNQALRFNSSWLTGPPTRLHALPGDMTRIDVIVPGTFSWRPGQHCYIRVPTLSLLDNHPFTIASSPQPPRKAETLTAPDKSNVQVLSFFARTHTGFTRKLSHHLQQPAELALHAWIDGPYGGHTRRIENAYDTFILVAGGAGITPCLAWLLYLAERMRSQSVLATHVKLVWAAKSEEHLGWVSDELKRVLDIAPAASVTMDFFVTDQERELSGELAYLPVPKGHRIEGSLDVKESSDIRAHELSMPSLHQGRPNLTQLVPDLIPSGRTVVIGCGPRSLQLDLSNAIASAQFMVSRGLAQEIALQTEKFDW